MIEVTDANSLNKQLSCNQKVVALFFASWCPFCRSFLTVFNKHTENSGKAIFMRVKIDEYENPLWETYALEAVPTVILFEEGKISRRLDCKAGRGLTEKQFKNWLAIQ